jgi:hypothetical protein
MLAVQTWLIKARDSAPTDAASYRIPAQLSAKLAAVRTKGLPAGLAAAFKAMRGAVDRYAAVFSEMPADDAAAAKWIGEKFKDNQFAELAGSRQAAMDDAGMELVAKADACGSGGSSDLSPTSMAAQTKDRWVVILAASKSFEEAKAEAQKAAKATSTLFSLRGMIFDKKGLRLPDNHEDELYAGQYVLRTGNACMEDGHEAENHISVEMSADYEGMAPGFYIAVACIAESAAAAEQKAAEFKAAAPSAYVKKTRIFLGCDR